MMVPKFKVAGLDLSLTGTGVVIVSAYGPTVWEAVATLVESKAPARLSTTGFKSPHVPYGLGKEKPVLFVPAWSQAERLSILAARITEAASGADLAVIEAPSLGSSHGLAHERAGLYWMVATSLHTWGIPFAVVAPRARAKYATGDGAANKVSVVRATLATYQPSWTDDNLCDALVLAAMGCRAAGYPLERWTNDPDRLDALRPVRWPLDRKGWKES